MKTVCKIMVFIVLTLLLQTTLVEAQDYSSFLSEDVSKKNKKSPPIELNNPTMVLDESCFNYEGLPPIGDQETQNAGSSWATAYYYLSYLQGEEFEWDLADPDHQMSPAFAYNLLNKGVNGGSLVYQAFLLLEEIGCSSMSDMPFVMNDFISFPTEEAFRNASQFRIDEPLYINFTTPQGETDFKNHLLNGHIAVMSFEAYQNFVSIENFNNTYCMSDIYGSNFPHASACIGFDDNFETNDGIGAWRMVNSFGEEWGDGGYWWLSYECARQSVVTNPNAFYAADKIDYQPSTIARVQINHSDRHKLKFGMFFQNSSEYKEYFTFNDFTSRFFDDIPFDPNVFILDITDVSEGITSDDMNMFSFSVFDLEGNDGHSGEIISLAIEDVSTGFSSESIETPVIIPDSFDEVVIDVNLYFPAVRPENFLAEIDPANGIVELSWSEIEINEDFIGYDIFRDNVLIDNITENVYLDTLLNYGVYHYAVRSTWQSANSQLTDIETIYWIEPVGTSNLHLASIEENGDCLLSWDQTRLADMIFDDGSAEDHLYFNDNTPPGAKIAQNFNPEGSGKVKRIGAYIGSVEDVENGYFRLAVFSNSDENQPSSQLWISDQLMPEGSDYWYWFDLEIERVWVSNDQTFWVAFIWDENGKTPLGIDSNGSSNGNFLGNVNGQTWFVIGNANPMIRVEYGIDEYIGQNEGLEGFNIYKNDIFAEIVNSDNHYSNINLESSGDYTFRADAVYQQGIVTGEDLEFYWDGNAADVIEDNLPDVWSVATPYPNPFNPSTMLTVEMASVAELNVEVFNILGQRVATLAAGRYESGAHKLHFDAKGLTSGIYFIRTEVPGKIRSIQKVTFIQ